MGGGGVLSSAPLKEDPNRVLTRMPSLTGNDSSSHWELLYVSVFWGLASNLARYLGAFNMRRQTFRARLNNTLIFLFFFHLQACRNATL